MKGPAKVLRQVDLVCPSCKSTLENEMIERYLDENNDAIGDEEVLCVCGELMKIQNGSPVYGKHSSFRSWDNGGMVG